MDLACALSTSKRSWTRWKILASSYLTLNIFWNFGHLDSVQFSSVAQSCPTLCDPMNRSTPGLPVHHHLPEFTQTHVHRVGDAIQPSHPLSSPFPPALIPPSIRVFSNESTLHMRWPKYWSFSFSIKLESRLLGDISITSDILSPTPGACSNSCPSSW